MGYNCPLRTASLTEVSPNFSNSEFSFSATENQSRASCTSFDSMTTCTINRDSSIQTLQSWQSEQEDTFEAHASVNQTFQQEEQSTKTFEQNERVSTSSSKTIPLSAHPAFSNELQEVEDEMQKLLKELEQYE